MSVTEQVASMVDEAEKAEATVDLAVRAVRRLLSETGETFAGLCQAVESATCKDVLKSVFQKFNAFTSFIVDAATASQHFALDRS